MGSDLTRGQPPIHPRVLAGVILYGLLARTRSSRVLEEVLGVRLDFRWLAEGRTIDRTTLSTFRKPHPKALKYLFVQIGLVARELGPVTLARKWPRTRSPHRRPLPPDPARSPQVLPRTGEVGIRKPCGIRTRQSTGRAALGD